MENSTRPLQTNGNPFVIWLMSCYLLLITFDGLFRAVAVKTGLILLMAWKEAFLFFILYFGFIQFFFYGAYRRPGLRLSFPCLTISLIVLGVFGVFYGLILQSIEPWQGVWGFKILYLPIFLFIYIQIFPAELKSDFLEKLMRWLLIAAVPIVLFGVWQFFMGWRDVSLLFLDREVLGGEAVRVITIGRFLRAFSTLRDPFSFGDFCSMLLVFNTAILLTARLKSKFTIFMELLLIVGLCVSTSRVSMITAVVGMILLCILVAPLRKNIKKLIIVGFVLSVLIGMCCLGYFLAFHAQILGDRGSYIGTIVSTHSVLERFFQWGNVFKTFSFDHLHNLIFGWGTGVVGAAQRKFTEHYFFIDNFYLLIFIMHGVVGLIIWMGFLGRVFVRLVNFVAEDDARRIPYYWFIAGTLVFLVCYLIEFLFRTGLEGFPMQIYFWAFLGLSLRFLQTQLDRHSGLPEREGKQ